MEATARYDPEADALYVRFGDQPYAYGHDLDPERRIDFAADHTPIGVELLCVSSGVHLADLPHAGQIAEILKSHNIKVLVR